MKYKHVVFFSLFLFSFFSILFHTNIPVIWPDEVLFFSPAFELGINGIMRTNVLNGLIPGMDTHTLWMPPAYIILLSGVFQFFPTELLTARLFSSFISLGSILLVYRICLQYQFSFKRTSLVLLLLASDFLFLKFSHTARMESLCLFFALLAFYFILRNAHVPLRRDLINQVLTKGDIATIPTRFDIFLSGICLSFSFLSHPFGIVHSIPVLFLLYQRNALTIQNLALYSFAGLLPIAAWGVYVVPNWELFIVQFGAQLSRKNELLGKFTWLDKVKIIFSVYKFPMVKLGLFATTIALLFYGLISQKKKGTNANNSLLLWIKNSPEIFFFVWLFTLLGFLFVSSESWYVFHIVVPFTLLLSAMIDSKEKPVRIFLFVSIVYNILVLIWVPFSVYFLYKSPEKTEEFFLLIEKEIERKNNIYLQAIPDPYFYLKKKSPEKTLHEFIPGELSAIQDKNPDGSEKKNLLKRLGIAKENYKIDANFYKETIHKQEVFIFYNESLMNDYIRAYLSKNANKFERKLLHVETPKGSDLKLEAVIFVQK
jgi:hypothetical protein